MFSKACEYGIRAVIYIWFQSKDGRKIGIRDICKEIDAPEFFTAKVLQTLSRLHMISSTKGPNGGFFIDEDQENIRLIDIVTAIDGDQLFTGCGLGLKVCSETNPCPIHDSFKSIRDQIREMLSQTTIRTLADDLESGKVFLKRMVI